LSRPSILLPANPRLNYLAHKAEIDAAVMGVLEGGWYILGKEVSSFEEEFAACVGAKAAVGVASGTDALELALRACGVGPGDAVVTVAHTAIATLSAIDLAGATPILADVDPATHTMDPDRLESALVGLKGSRIKAVIPVHLYGHPADMAAIMEIAQRYGLYVIEDCAQSHGAKWNGRATGTWGHVGAFSFYPTKNLGALGDGGALVTDDPDLAEKARLLRQYGWRERYVSDLPGMNSRLDEVQAAILRVKLRSLNAENERRRHVARTYARLLEGCALELPQERDGAYHVFHQYTLRSADRDDLRAYLQSHAIGTAILYPVPAHRQPGYADRVVVGSGGLERTETLCGEILSLPMYPELTDEQVEDIANLIREWSRSGRER
jgi:dTDP-4-amino-4,6-dideoxygalactose transaminase